MHRGVRSGVWMALMLVWASSASAQGTTIRYRWPAGTVEHYRLTQKTVATVSGIPGAPPQTVEQSVSQAITMKVIEVAADGSATLQQTFDSVRMEMPTPNGPAVIDSTSKDRPSDPAMAHLSDIMSAISGQAVTIVLGPTGEVTRFEGMAAIFDRMIAGMPAGAASDPLIVSVKASMSDDAMKRTFSQSFTAFPDRPITIGDTWTSNFEVAQPMLGTMTTVRTSTLEALDPANGSTVARIGVTMAIKQTAEAPATGMPLKITMGQATGTGTMTFDVGKGRLERSSTTIEIPMTMTGAGPDGSAMTVQNQARTIVTMERVPPQ